ncbi:MAG: hypothetical protein HZA93_27400 [Verrucomicrobia bacterium]|nr:hypothetical protein [Verrucomicrobiota bacterium]
MSPSRQALRRPARASRGTGGFTLLEFFLVLLALGLAGYIAVSETGKSQHRARLDQFIAELRTIAGVFETYRAQKGAWPPATNPDIRTPLGMESALAATRWRAGPPFGGTYEWQPPFRPAADDKDAASSKPIRGGAIALTAFSPHPPLALTADDLRYIDARLDDGNLATGRFRTGFNGWPVYLIEPGP